MHDKKISVEEVERYQPKFDEGLSLEQVSSRMEQGLSNKTDVIVGKSTWEILRTSVLTFFNILLFIIAGVMIYANVNSPELPWYHGLFFVIILLSNIIIGLYQDLKAKHLMKKMKLMEKMVLRQMIFY